MAQRVTVQDIANALNISRNTVSKALNNTGVLADSTRDKILQKASEMGYKQFAYTSPLLSPSAPLPTVSQEIALLTCSMPNSSHFGSKLLDTFQPHISENNFRLSIYRIQEDDLKNLSLPTGFNPEQVAGILCIEVFHHAYSQMLCSLDIPTLFVDTAANPYGYEMDADLLYMENHDSIYQLVQHFLKEGVTSIGFAGNITHCHSFYERYTGYRDALWDANIPLDLSLCLTDSKPFVDIVELVAYLRQMPRLPEVFICANDFVCIDLIKALKILSLDIPTDIRVTGFDNSSESRIIDPPLTTVHIPSNAMGIQAAELLHSRIAEPGIPYRKLYVRTIIKHRTSSQNQN